LRCHHEIVCYDPKRQAQEGWLNLSQAAHLPGVTNRTLRLAIDHGYITAERLIAGGPWVINKQSLESEDATHILERVRLGKAHPAVPSSVQAVIDLSTT
jgi:hypothetical protein